MLDRIVENKQKQGAERFPVFVVCHEENHQNHLTNK
jgi:hypothetical protein